MGLGLLGEEGGRDFEDGIVTAIVLGGMEGLDGGQIGWMGFSQGDNEAYGDDGDDDGRRR